MDMDTFSQCLTYVQAATSNKAQLDKVLPIIGTLLGTGLGFGLNQFVSWRKEGRSKQSKKLCCEEDLHELISVSKLGIAAALEFGHSLASHIRPANHNLPRYIDAPLLDKYYYEIAHNFSMDQRYWIKLVFRNIEEVNMELEQLLDPKETSLFRLSLTVLNLEMSLRRLMLLAQSAHENTFHVISESTDFLLFLGMDKSHVESLQALAENAQERNKILALSNK
ncbi:hypothetical protein [Pseudomonas sp. NBRC 111121]|uniref:hypothetical protein n=1 Tax=Pseudomonas sp. NBRC 111121 TaxID=1661036 RepID=UPI000761C1C9|nr:hypothetical protein [Pseudomonas sp. NBRC 111121]